MRLSSWQCCWPRRGESFNVHEVCRPLLICRFFAKFAENGKWIGALRK